MNKKIISFIICLLFTFCCFPQPNQYGFKIGASIPDIKGNTEQSKDYTSRLAGFFGVSLTKKLSGYFNLQTEINYSPQGGKRNGLQPIQNSLPGIPEGTLLYANFKTETKLNYIEVPLLLQLCGEKPENDYGIFYFINLGPYVAMRLNSKTVTSGNSFIYVDKEGTMVATTAEGTPYPTQSFNSNTNIKNEVKRMNFGITGGAGSGYDFDGHKFFIEARFTRGLLPIQTHSEGGKNKTGSVIFAAGYVYCFQ